MASPTALHGIRVLDFTRVLAGPFATMLLADLGAEVIKVESPTQGDETREWGPPWHGPPADRLSAYYLSVNRNKRSLTLNLKHAEGQAIARRLAAQSQVVIENMKVGSMAGFGLDYDALRALNPVLVYCSISGFGQDGPYAARPGYDYVVQAMSGLMSITGEPDGEAHKVGVAVSDVFTGLFAANAVQAALRHAERSGQGQYIEVSLLESQIAALVNVASNVLVSGQDAPRWGNGHPNIVPYQVFHAADKPFVLAVGNDRQFTALCQWIGLPEVPQDDRFRTNAARVAHRAELVALLKARFRQREAEAWVEGLLALGIPAGPINTVQQALDDPHVTGRGLVETVQMPDGSALRMVGPAARLSATPARIESPPPQVGEHTESILRDLLGMTADEITALREQSVI
jgi:crotonobetainyl-CoA:carnitine CoA-transferase CaiB-like acyl-CoA transferase